MIKVCISEGNLHKSKKVVTTWNLVYLYNLVTSLGYTLLFGFLNNDKIHEWLYFSVHN